MTLSFVCNRHRFVFFLSGSWCKIRSLFIENKLATKVLASYDLVFVIGFSLLLGNWISSICSWICIDSLVCFRVYVTCVPSKSGFSVAAFRDDLLVILGSRPCSHHCYDWISRLSCYLLLIVLLILCIVELIGIRAYFCSRCCLHCRDLVLLSGDCHFIADVSMETLSVFLFYWFSTVIIQFLLAGISVSLFSRSFLSFHWSFQGAYETFFRYKVSLWPFLVWELSALMALLSRWYWSKKWGRIVDLLIVVWPFWSQYVYGWGRLPTSSRQITLLCLSLVFAKWGEQNGMIEYFVTLESLPRPWVFLIWMQ